jgi:hypothetical protein
VLPDCLAGHRIAQQIQACSWLVVIGCHDPDVISSLHNDCPLILVVQPNQVLAERLKDEWSGALPMGIYISSEIIGETEMEIPWYRFNDARHDGTVPPEILKSQYPNISFKSQETRLQLTFEGAVRRWHDSIGIHQEKSGKRRGGLLVRVAGLETTLSSAGSILEELQFIVAWQEGGGSLQTLPISESLSEKLRHAYLLQMQSEREDIVHWSFDDYSRLKDENLKVSELNCQLMHKHEQLFKTFSLLSFQSDRLEIDNAELKSCWQTSNAAANQLRSENSRLKQAHALLQIDNNELRKMYGQLKTHNQNQKEKQNLLIKTNRGLQAQTAGLQQQISTLNMTTLNLKREVFEIEKAYSDLDNLHQELSLVTEDLRKQRDAICEENKAICNYANSQQQQYTSLLCTTSELKAQTVDLQQKLHGLQITTESLEQERDQLQEHNAGLIQRCEVFERNYSQSEADIQRLNEEVQLLLSDQKELTELNTHIKQHLALLMDLFMEVSAKQPDLE